MPFRKKLQTDESSDMLLLLQKRFEAIHGVGAHSDDSGDNWDDDNNADWNDVDWGGDNDRIV